MITNMFAKVFLLLVAAMLLADKILRPLYFISHNPVLDIVSLSLLLFMLPVTPPLSSGTYSQPLSLGGVTSRCVIGG